MAENASQQVNLLFDRPPATDTNLVFGADFVPPRNDLTVQAVLPLPNANVRFVPNTRLDFHAVFPPLTIDSVVRPVVPLNVGSDQGVVLPGVEFASEVRYFSHTQRPTVGQTKHLWQVAQRKEDGLTQVQQDASANLSGWVAPWGHTRFQLEGILHRLPPVLSASREQWRARHQDTMPLHNQPLFSQQEATRTTQQRIGLFQNASKTSNGTQFRHQDCNRTRRGFLVQRYQNTMRFHVRGYSGSFQSATAFINGLLGRYQDAVPPPAGVSIFVLPQPPGPPPCYAPSANLVFGVSWSGDTNLLFVCDEYVPPGPPPVTPNTIVPVRRVYIVMNEVRLFKVNGNLELPVISMSLDLDMSSWAWGFNATLPGSTLPELLSSGTNSPIELEAVVNGEHFRLLAEKVSRSRSFGQSSVSVSGRGISAYLSSPYSPKQNFSVTSEVTAQQLMNNILTFNGVPLGWTIDWQITDWLVPAGVWSTHGTYMDGLANIVSAVGAFILPHKTNKTLSIKAMYETLPWEWATATPDIELPSSVIQTESIKWEEYPDYNGVYVSGVSQGVIGWVKRTGSAGNYLAPMVTDPLITTADAARMRGRCILAGAGKKAIFTLSLPILPETGIITPGKLIRYNDNGTLITGVTKSVSVSTEFPKVRQTIEVETHA